jgi:hypothetical protein
MKKELTPDELAIVIGMLGTNAPAKGTVPSTMPKTNWNELVTRARGYKAPYSMAELDDIRRAASHLASSEDPNIRADGHWMARFAGIPFN